ncbi:endoglucanase [Pseudohyphozyma bogoriensis]|nr:endoglucanase [Pseudohyphozyma bogoriensis]
MIARYVLALLAVAGLAAAHIEMEYPPPINSKFDSQTPSAQIDYSMTSPLDANGDNYPCKGYNTAANIAALNSVATLTPGGSVSTTFSGTATHEGGSCQFSLSYDGGETWAVIYSIEGGCPIDLAYDVPIPSDVPAMDKAFDIGGTSTAAYTAPAIYRANTFADGTCIVPENTNVVFPNPGKQVFFPTDSTGGQLSSSSAATSLSPCSQDYTADVTVSPSSSSSSGSSSGSGSSSSAVGSTTTVKAATSTKPATTTTAVAQSSSKGAATSSFSLSNTNLASLAVGSTTTSAAAAAGTTSISQSGNSTAVTGSSSSGNATSVTGAYIKCLSSSTWALCGTTICTEMGSVAAGTECVDGAIKATSKKQKRARSFERRRGVHSHASRNLGRH